eukprot:gene18433-18295_t
MNVSLSQEQQAFIEQAAVRLLEAQDTKHQLLKRDIELGLESGDAGDLDEASIEDVKARGRARLAAKLAAE